MRSLLGWRVLNCCAYRDLITGYLFSYIFPKGPDATPDRAAIDAALPAVERHVSLLEATLGGRDWLVGDRRTRPDIFHASVLSYVAQLQDTAERFVPGTPPGDFMGRWGVRESSTASTPPPPPASRS